MEDVVNFVIVGVGGQGILLASSIVSEVAVRAGFDVKSNEVHGMAQRGGSVISQIRYGEKVYSPLVMEKSAQYLVSMEKAEALRYRHLCNSNTRVVVNDLMIVPVTVSSGTDEYPEDIDGILGSTFLSFSMIKAQDIAQQAGSIRAVNVVLIGAVSNYLSFEDELYMQAIKNLVKQQYIDINIKAFYMGKEALATSER